MPDTSPTPVDAPFPPYLDIARAFHERYERLAPRFGYKTRDASAVPWEQVPEANRLLMHEVVRELVRDGVIALRSRASIGPDSDDISQPIDSGGSELATIRRALHSCHEAGPCWCDARAPVIVAALRDARLRSIGPDSERIRELEAEVERLRAEVLRQAGARRDF